MMKRLLTGLISIYKICISPVLPPSCRFYPSCSEYSMQAINDHGALKGIWLTVWRLLRCHPFHPGGYDPVPPAADHAAVTDSEAPQAALNLPCAGLKEHKNASHP